MGMGGGGGGGRASKLKRAAMKMIETCGSFSRSSRQQTNHVDPLPGSIATNNPPTTPKSACATKIKAQSDSSTATSSKNLCAICLDPLHYSSTGSSSSSSPGQAIFTAQCSHAFHFGCITSNVRHGGVTCPICRAHWTQLPRNLNTPSLLYATQSGGDPVLQILDDSIATFRVHRRSFLRSARYDDDDPIEPVPDHTPNRPRLHLTLSSIPPSLAPNPTSCFHHHTTRPNLSPPPAAAQHFGDQNPCPRVSSNSNRSSSSYLCVKLSHQPATDLVLVASPNGPHLRLIKQSMAFVVFSLRSIDRLAIVTYSSAAARIFPLRRMTPYGKRTALQVIDRLFYTGQADPFEGLKKGVKILGDRTHENPHACILHLSDSPTRSYGRGFDMEVPIHRFHVGFGFGTSSGFVMHEFGEFLARVVGGAIRDIQLRIGEDGGIVRLGELRGGEERRIPLNTCMLGDFGHVCVDYSYIEGGVDEYGIRTGEVVVGMGEDHKREATSDGDDDDHDDDCIEAAGERTSSVGSWDYHDPFMARRWAKHLHGYRL